MNNSIIDFSLQYGDKSFSGFRFLHYVNFPWNSKKSKKAFYDKLESEKTDYNKQKMLDLMILETDEDLHVTLSWSILSYFMIWVLIVVSIGFLLKGFSSISYTIFGLGLLSCYLRYRLIKRLENIYDMYSKHTGLIDIIFDKTSFYNNSDIKESKGFIKIDLNTGELLSK